MCLSRAAKKLNLKGASRHRRFDALQTYASVANVEGLAFTRVVKLGSGIMVHEHGKHGMSRDCDLAVRRLSLTSLLPALL